jgi:hypothetical protein
MKPVRGSVYGTNVNEACVVNYNVAMKSQFPFEPPLQLLDPIPIDPALGPSTEPEIEVHAVSDQEMKTSCVFRLVGDAATKPSDKTPRQRATSDKRRDNKWQKFVQHDCVLPQETSSTSEA